MSLKLIELTEKSEVSGNGLRVYDLSVADSNSFTANGYIVHNSGSACSTRVKTGVGYPQLSAVLEVADAVHGIGGHIISDGGITCPGDVAKATAAGADMVMLGSFFSGCDEGGGEVLSIEGQPKTVKFYGMSSRTAQLAHGSDLSDYRASEGRVLSVPYKGSIHPIIQDLLGSLRSTCTYVGAKTLKELPKRTTFVRVHNQIAALYGMGELMS